MTDTPHRPFPIPVVAATAEATTPAEARPLEGIQDVVLVASGKGGVGKSTLTVNLACELAHRGQRVGVLDADVYGPSVQRMLGTADEALYTPEGRMRPFEAHGLYSLSVGNVLPVESALAWKGPLVSQVLVQMVREVHWPALDLLLVDLPPGTGDVPLTLLEEIPVTGALVVTTPQSLALADADRGISLFHEYDVPVLGLVENMAGFVCPCCGEVQALFPGGGAEGLARRRHVRLLGAVPLAPAAQECADAGRPLVLEADAAAPFAAAMARVTDELQAGLAREQAARTRAADPAAQADSRAFWERLLD